MKDKIKKVVNVINDKKYYLCALGTMLYESMLPIHGALGGYTEKVVNKAGSEVEGMLISTGIGVVIACGVCLGIQRRKTAIVLIVGYVIGAIIIKNRVALGGLINTMS